MTDVNTIIQTTITRDSAVATLPGFGVPAVFNQFAAGTKGFTGTSRTKYYYSTSELLADGWAATDSVYQWASAVFAQNPRVPKLLVGRIDSGDASVAASGDAIRAEQDDFYVFEVVGNRSLVFTLSADLVTDNVLSSTVNGITVAPVTYATSHAYTMGLWKAAIESAIVGATATVSGRTMTVTMVGKDMNVGTAVVTLGASQATVTYSYPLDATKTKAWMAWTEGQKKMLGVQDSDVATYAADTGVSGTACLAEYAKLMSYERTFVLWHALNAEYAMAAWVGDQLPYDPGQTTWAFKTLAGVSPDTLTTGQENLIRGKNANVYTPTAGVYNTYAGTCAKTSRYIDDQRGLDWLDTQIKLDQMNLRFNMGKIPFDDPGILLCVTCLKGTLKKAADAKVLTSDYSVTYPKASEVSSANKAARILPSVNFSATLSGAIHSIQITGTVSV